MAKSLSALVKEARSKKRWSMKVAADACGLNYTTYVEIEKGRTKEPPPATLRGIADGLEIEMFDLMEAAYGAPVMRGLRPA